jgi:hypothetical protein
MPEAHALRRTVLLAARDYVGLVEAAYAPAATDAEWVEGLTRAALPIVARDKKQLLAYTYWHGRTELMQYCGRSHPTKEA